MKKRWHSTTIIAVKVGKDIAMAGDGQVTLSNTIMKRKAQKVRKIFNSRVLAGFAGTAGDAQTLFSRFEDKLEEYHGNLKRAAVELAKDWRTDKVLRRLEALLIVADAESLLVISGSGEIIEPDDNIAAIGSGGPLALAAARALAKHTSLDAKAIATEAVQIASSICIYTNGEITVETIDAK